MILVTAAIVAVIVQGVSAGAAAADSGVVWCSGMEESDLNGNWDHQSALEQQYADSGPFDTPGNNVARITGLSRRWSSQGWERLYCRYYQKFESGYDFTAACHNGGAISGGTNCYGCAGNRAPTGPDGWFWGTLESCYNDLRRLHYYLYYPGQKMDCSDPSGSCWGDHIPCMISDGYCDRIPDYKAPPMPLPPLMEDNRWYCIEMMCDVGDPTSSATGANGMLDFWIDGTEYGPFENLWFRSDPNVLVDLIAFMMYYHDGNPNGKTILIDDVVVSTSPIGCGQRVDSSLSLVSVTSAVNRERASYGPPRPLSAVDGTGAASPALMHDIRGRLVAAEAGLSPGVYCFRKGNRAPGVLALLR